MTIHDPKDQQFDDNLRAFGAANETPEGLSPEARERASSTLGAAPARRMRRGILRRTGVLSTIGMAAALALFVGILNPFGGAPKVEAAAVLTKLTKQIAENELIEIEISNLAMEGVRVDGTLSVNGHAVAGDIRAHVHQNGVNEVKVDLALAISENAGWVLLRELEIDDPQAQMFINMFLPPGNPTLIHLPSDVIDEVIEESLEEALSDVRKEAGGEIAQMVGALLNAGGDSGLDVTDLGGGIVRLELDLKDTEGLENLVRTLMRANGEEPPEDLDIDLGKDAEMILGSELAVVFDTNVNEVREFSIEGFGDANGSIRVAMTGGTIDPARLDPDRVTDSSTRVLDLGAFIEAAKGMQHAFDK